MASLSAAHRAKCADQIGISVRRFLPGKAVKKGNVKEEEWLLLLSGAELREGREKWAEETFARQRPDKKARLTIKKKWFQEETTQEVFVAPPPVFDFWKVGVRCPDERHVQILLGREDCFEASEVLPVFGRDKDKKKSFIPQEHGLDEREEIIEIPDGYEAVCAGAFCGWSRLREIRFSDAVVEIGDRAFAGCTQLSKIGWSENVKAIGNEAFCRCDKLCRAALPNRLEVIGRGAFGDCAGLRSIFLPGSLKKIGADAFLGCPVEEIEEGEGLDTQIAYQMKRKFPTARWSGKGKGEEKKTEKKNAGRTEKDG